MIVPHAHVKEFQSAPIAKSSVSSCSSATPAAPDRHGRDEQDRAETSKRRRWKRALKALRPNRLVKILSGAATVWFFLPEKSDTASTIHRTFSRHAWRDGSAADRALLCVGTLVWIPATLVLIVLCVRKAGPRVKAQTGKGILRQAAEQARLAYLEGVPPPWYYVFEFHADDKRQRALEYLYRQETKDAIYDVMRRQLSLAESTDALSNKVEFVRRCSANGLAVVGALATADAGHVEMSDGATALPQRDLFLKPVRGAGGRGAERWCHEGAGTYRNHAGKELTADGLLSHVENLSRIEPYVVRPCVRNHPDILDLSPFALSTIRLVTIRDEAGAIEVTHAFMRMARAADVVVDNFHAGGVAAKVDLATGRLGRASDMGLSATSRWWDVHPASGAAILGRKIPHWDEVLSLARRAHAVWSDQVTIGWDIAVLDDGPVLVEGNKSPDLDIIQRICEEPLGNGRFGDLLLFHLRRALEARAPGADALASGRLSQA